ncbi:MAG: FAD-dependent oxidoreductase, partial [Gammaproteobacteria bacterium]|nr:FAD-dependent oxidoreductase [Gammaproteobacteria bacterium]
HENIGKVIVATSEEQFDVLRNYQKQAQINGVGELDWLDKEQVQALEPSVNCLAGVWSSTTGIIDSHAFMLSLQGDLETHGSMIAFNTNVKQLVFEPTLQAVCEDMVLEPEFLVNSAGLHAPEFAVQAGGDYRSYYAKGHYYTLSGKSPFNHLVYPIAEAGGLGVHVTLDMAHQARFGPDVVWTNEIDYDFEEDQFEAFATAIRSYYPDLDESKLQPGYTGIRPKLVPQGEPANDFVINGPQETGHAGYVELLGIESPGLTASLAIAERVIELLG